MFFFPLRAHLFVPAPLSETSRGVGTIRPWGSHCRRFGAIRAVCRAWQAFQTFLALDTLEANPRVSATSPGIGLLHPLSPCTHVRFGCKPGFSARRGYPHISLFLHRAQRYDPAYQQQSSPLAAAPCNSMRVRLAAVVVGDYFDRSLRCSTRLYAAINTSRCCYCYFCSFCQVTCRRKM